MKEITKLFGQQSLNILVIHLNYTIEMFFLYLLILIKEYRIILNLKLVLKKVDLIQILHI
jgi:hypothetical protein